MRKDAQLMQKQPGDVAQSTESLPRNAMYDAQGGMLLVLA